ncbi:hypothetical protein [Azorhizophilus paspali]
MSLLDGFGFRFPVGIAFGFETARPQGEMDRHCHDGESGDRCGANPEIIHEDPW